MNILVLDEEPVVCAEYYADRDIAKKIIEYAELATMAHLLLDGKPAAASRLGINIPTGGRRFYHCMAASWVRASSGNYLWLHALTMALVDQMHQRFGFRAAFTDKDASREFGRFRAKFGEVPYEDALREMHKLPLNITKAPLQRFVFSVPSNCRRGIDAVAAYRAYYCNHYDDPVWTPPAKTPEWYKPVVHEEVS